MPILLSQFVSKYDTLIAKANYVLCERSVPWTRRLYVAISGWESFTGTHLPTPEGWKAELL